MTGTVRFTDADVAAFASASGDHNPLHVDPAFARSTPFGRTVVHGALAAITVLPRLGDVNGARFLFREAVFTDEPYRIDRGEGRVSLSGRGQAALKATPRLGRLRPPPSTGPTALLHDPTTRTTPRMHREITPGVVLTGSYEPRWDDLAAVAGRPVGTADLALAFAGYASGMLLPGRDGVLAEIDLRVHAPSPPRHALGYRLHVEDHDPRSGLTTSSAILTAGGSPLAELRLCSFAGRRAPQPTLDRVARHLRPGSGLSGHTVLVVGCSRGFGAALTLALLSQGATVHGTYAASPRAAVQLALHSGPHSSRLWLHQADATDPAAMRNVLTAAGDLTGVVLNATPPLHPITLSPDAATEARRHTDLAIAAAMVPLGCALPALTRGWVAFVSTEALAAPPAQWPHYVAAKAAIEGLAAWLEHNRPDVDAVVLRLPAMRTELTNTPVGHLDARTPEEVAARVVRRMLDQDWATTCWSFPEEATIR
ncbi:NAD(P)-dependent dehydrogenase (short-subunit alcohol dehydrogenase family) [Saccharothrix tamanrassetensis]|uniref:NAD(P)-dependent dehydrogenase (Short-subunit alcohol dehydrogenase family) n=1 Tax=Saccharothrix tamanrassetensis TaxID=1051531 RepID=A0A841C9R6_9PSEU|nr:SDR family NAD(P)-dependent oxidoreductase [Saccharothrix tamanrassetensis]MBB5953683.1 NAD(P)-dependent dehydrogenase (short-subunit alcohol dehydrogenase family) [Saccharothrix tamanrassetensis]